MPTLKEKVAILKSLENSPFDSTRITEYLSFAGIPDMTNSILKKVLKYLIDCDSEISASYEGISDENWDSLVSNKPSIIDVNFELKAVIDCLAMHFVSFYKILENNEISLILEVLSEIFKVKTRNIQFLLFLTAKRHPRQVFAFLISKMKKAPVIYAPFFSSLLVRLKFDPEIKEKCFIAFKRHLKSLKPSKSIHYLALLQSYCYVLCFKEFVIDSESIEIIKKANDLSLFPFMNKDVILKLFSLSEIKRLELKEPVFNSLENTCLYYFPFDLPIIPKISQMIEEDFVSFE